MRQREVEYVNVRRRESAPSTRCIECGARTFGKELCGQCLYDEMAERHGYNLDYDHEHNYDD